MDITRAVIDEGPGDAAAHLFDIDREVKIIKKGDDSMDDIFASNGS